MTIKQAFQIAQTHNCMISRYRPGVYCIAWSDGSQAHEVRICGKTVKCAADWIVANRGAK